MTDDTVVKRKDKEDTDGKTEEDEKKEWHGEKMRTKSEVINPATQRKNEKELRWNEEGTTRRWRDGDLVRQHMTTIEAYTRTT